MKIIDVLGKPCPIPVIEAKKALAAKEADCVLVKVDNEISVQNLEKMAKSFGYSFSYNKSSEASYEVTIALDGKTPPVLSAQNTKSMESASKAGPIVIISGNTMGRGAEELGKILIKGFIYSLTELAVPPTCVIFLNSGAYLTAEGSNVIDDLKKLEQKGTGVFTCGTCANFYELQGKLSVGSITDMYGITEKLVSGLTVINI